MRWRHVRDKTTASPRDNGAPTRAAVGDGSLSLGTSSVRQSIRRAAARVQLRPLHNPTKSKIERWILMSILESPAISLASGLIDRATGLPKNNLQVACHRAGAPRAFRCVAGLLGDPRGDRLYIRYRGKPGGRSTFTWSRKPRRQTASIGTYFK